MAEQEKMGFWSATSIGLGAMIGAGIFALTGIAIEMTGVLACLSFALAGGIALLTAYSVAKLAVRFPSKGGRVKFLTEGFGKGLTSGGLNILMWIGYIIVTSLYARAFSEYAFSVLPPGTSELWHHFLVSGIVVLFVGINIVGAKAVGRSELFIVMVKVILLLGFSLAGLFFIEPANFRLPESAGPRNMLVVTGLVFLSYEGFGLVANTAEDVDNPKKNIPRALYTSIFLVMAIYILVTVVVAGTLSVAEIAEAKEYVLAEAVRPMLGTMGFRLMVVAALFSTASAINATIYGPVYMIEETARAGQVPSVFKKSLFGREAGAALLITGAMILFFANVLDLTSIAKLGSITFLIIYISVNLAHLRLRRKTGGDRRIIWTAVLGCGFVLSILLLHELRTSPVTVLIFLCVALGTFIFEYVYLRYKH